MQHLDRLALQRRAVELVGAAVVGEQLRQLAALVAVDLHGHHDVLVERLRRLLVLEVEGEEEAELLRVGGERGGGDGERPGRDEALRDRRVHLVLLEHLAGADLVQLGDVRAGQPDEEQEDEGGAEAEEGEQHLALVHDVEVHLQAPGARDII